MNTNILNKKELKKYMNLRFKQNLSFTLNILFLFLLVFGSIVWADTNGVWHDTKDIRGGIFGSDEQDVTTVYSFINQVLFNSSVIVNSNLNVTGNISANKICFGNDCKSSWSEVGGSVPSPPTCSGNDGLQWNGTNWSCQTFAAGCSNECSFTNQKSCSGSNVITCGNYDTDSCLEYGGASACTNGCSSGACLVCNTQNSYSCYNGNVHWYDSCNNREGVKEYCSNGCSGNSCTTCNSNAYTSCYSGNLYWYDSCGNRGNQQSTCQYGCTTGTSSCSAPASCSGQYITPSIGGSSSYYRTNPPGQIYIPTLNSGGTYQYSCSQYTIADPNNWDDFYSGQAIVTCDNGILSDSGCSRSTQTCGPSNSYVYTPYSNQPLQAYYNNPYSYAATSTLYHSGDGGPYGPHYGDWYSPLSITNCPLSPEGEIWFNSLPEAMLGEKFTMNCNDYTKMVAKTTYTKKDCGGATAVALSGTITFRCDWSGYYGVRHAGGWIIESSNCAKK